MKRLDHFRDLLACLRGELPSAADWPSIIALANRTLCSPAVATRLQEAGRIPLLPADLQVFLSEVRRRNAERNRRLLLQLDELALLLNTGGVQPALLKGTAWLAQARPDQRAMRMLADLDLMVAPRHFAAAIDRLARIGYRLQAPSLGPEVPAVLWRPEDAATIDLHSDYGSAATLLCRFDDLATKATALDLPNGRAFLPSAVDRVAILLLHDQLKGRDYLRGRIDLRHLLDIQALAAGFRRAEWEELDRLFAKGYARNAARTQLLTARELLGVDVPDDFVSGVWPGLQLRRRKIQVNWPAIAPALTILSLLEPHYLVARRASKDVGGSSIDAEGPRGWLPRRSSLGRLLFRNELGKV